MKMAFSRIALTKAYRIALRRIPVSSELANNAGEVFRIRCVSRGILGGIHCAMRTRAPINGRFRRLRCSASAAGPDVIAIRICSMNGSKPSQPLQIRFARSLLPDQGGYCAYYQAFKPI